MLTFKDKIELLKKIKKEKIDLSDIDKYIEYLKQKSLVEPIFKKIITFLIDLDVEINSIYESISEEDWDDIMFEYDTPIEKPLYGLIKEKTRIFIDAYRKIDQIITKLNVNFLLDCFSLIPLCKSNSVQFLFFRLGCYKPRPVLCFLLENIKSNPIIYIPYFTSFVARCKINSKNAILQYIKYVENLKVGTSFNYILASQGLMYICCFKNEFIDQCKQIFDKVFSNNIYMNMNPTIVETFCKHVNYDIKMFKTLDNLSLFYFPFDKSPFDAIHELYAENYCEYKK